MDDADLLVAIVEDEEPIRSALVRLFRIAGLRVEAFASPAEFLSAPERPMPDCVVLDLHMPGMTGVELLRRLSGLDDPPPVVVMTADHEQNVEDECMLLGTAYYLRKPVDSRTLLESVRRAARVAQ